MESNFEVVKMGRSGEKLHLRFTGGAAMCHGRNPRSGLMVYRGEAKREHLCDRCFGNPKPEWLEEMGVKLVG